MHLRFDRVAHEGIYLRKLRNIRIVARAQETNQAEEEENGKCYGAVAPGTTKGLRKIMRKEFANPAAALRFGAIDTTMRANHQTVEVTDQSRVARLRQRNRQIG